MLLYDKIEPIAADKQKAHELANVLVDAIEGRHSDLATMDDLLLINKDLKNEIQDATKDLRNEMQATSKDLRNEMDLISKDLRNEMKVLSKDLHADMSKLEATMLKHMILGVSFLAALQTILKFVPRS